MKRSLQDLAMSTCIVIRMQCLPWVNLSKNRWLYLRNWGCEDRYSKREQNIQTCLNVLPNSAEFLAKILQDFNSCNEITFGLLAKVLIASATHYKHAHTRTLWIFQKNKRQSVYHLIINLLELFLSRIKYQLFVGKI